MSKQLVVDRSPWAGASRIHSSPLMRSQQRIRVSGLSKCQAEQLLDWLEANGYREYDLAYTAGKAFTVSYAGSSDGI